MYSSERTRKDLGTDLTCLTPAKSLRLNLRRSLLNDGDGNLQRHRRIVSSLLLLVQTASLRGQGNSLHHETRIHFTNDSKNTNMGPLRARRKLYANKADSRRECREGTWGVPGSVAIIV